MELHYVMKWQKGIADYQRRVNTFKAFKLETFSSNYMNQIRFFERKNNVVASNSMLSIGELLLLSVVRYGPYTIKMSLLLVSVGKE